MNTEKKDTWFQNLWNRKVPQYLGTYFAIGFGILQFLEFLTNRFNLSSALVDKYFLVWLTLVPAVATLIYFSDQLDPKTPSGLAKWPKFLVGGNVLLALVLAVLFRNEKEAQVEVVNLTNEEGETVTAVVPALKKVKTIASFQFENSTGDKEQDWWGVALSFLLEAALEQRPEFYVKSQIELDGYYNELELESFSLPNVGIQREISQKARSDYFTRIAYIKEGEDYILQGNLYSSKNGESILSINAKENSFYLAIDKVKEQIYKNIPDALEYDESQISLPSSSLVTANVESLKYLTEGLIALVKNPNENLDFVIDKTKASIASDASCAFCYSQMAVALITKGSTNEGIDMMKKAVKQGASLPQRMQFSYKQILYSITNNMDAYIKLQELKRKMFPYEFDSYELLAQLYKTNYGIDSAKVLIHEAIDNGNIEKGLLQLYDLQLEDEEYLEAEKTLDRYTKEFPDREQDRKKYADIYEKQGKIEKAKEILLEEEVIDPFDDIIQRRLAYLDFKNQNTKAALNRLDKGLQQSENLSDSLGYLRSKIYFLRLCGQVNDALEAISQYEKIALAKLPLINVLMEFAVLKGELSYSISRPEKIDEITDKIGEYVPQNKAAVKCITLETAFMRYPDNIFLGEEYQGFEELRKSFGEGYENYFNFMNAYRLADYKTCYEILDVDDGKLRKLFTGGEFVLADVHFKNNDVDTAKEILRKAIDQKPEDPIFYYRMALILENENKKEAREYLEIAMEYWANADDDFLLLKNANELSQRLLVLERTES